MSEILGIALGGVEKNRTFATCVFHSIRFKVNKGLGHSGDPFLLYPSLAFAFSKQVAIALH